MSAKGGREVLRRSLAEDGERADHRAWAGAFPSPLPAPPIQKARGVKPERAPVLPGPELLRSPQADQRLTLIKALHRHQDGYISFAFKDEDGGGGQRPAFAIKASALDNMLPGYADRLTKDSLLSINAGYTLAHRDKSDRGYPDHTNRNLKYLCACYCDIDHYKLGLTFHQARARVFDMCEAGVLPWMSMIVDSGRGMWLLWLLHDHTNPQHAHIGAWGVSEFDPLMIYSQVNQAICSRLKTIGGDPKASDGARYIRTPGSFRTDTSKAVWWSIQGTGDSGFSYTLWELADYFHVQCRRLMPIESAALAPKTRKTGSQSCGQIVATAQRLGAVNALIAIRNGFHEGDREIGLRHYAIALRYSGVSIEDAMRATLSMAELCHPPFLPASTRLCVKSAYNQGANGTKRWKFASFSRVLDVSREEAEIIAQRIGRPTFPAAGEQLQPLTRMDGKPKRSQETAARRAAIQSIVDEVGCVLSSRAMKVRLEALGHEASYVTILTDYRNLGFPPATHRGGEAVAERIAVRRNQGELGLAA